ncbi:hypothetical protein B0H14DRAFT_3444430 [Mycena olivaceomarginata]|nr:hypothetical protein B0H14DRAFT_3444430 [Mycena olivaceomarginata]
MLFASTLAEAMYRPTGARTRLKPSNLGLITYGELRPPHSYTIGGTGWNVGLHWGYVHHPASGSTASKYARLLSLLEPFRALRRQLCMPRYRRAICYAHVVSDDRSHSSSIVDRPTASACSSPTMNCPGLCTFANIISLLLVRDQRKRSAVYPPRALSLRHAKAIHPIRVSATSLTISITITATCAVPDVGDHIGAVGRCLAEVSYLRRPSASATLSSSVCPAVSNTAGSSQPLAPSIHQTSDALLVYKRPRRSDSALGPLPCSSPMRVPEASGAGSGMATRCDTGMMMWCAPRWRRVLGDMRREGDGWMDGREARVRRCARKSCAGWMQPSRVVVVDGRGASSEVEVVRRRIEVADTVRASRAYATTHDSPRSGATSGGVARACDWGVKLAIPLSSRERGVRAVCGRWPFAALMRTDGSLESVMEKHYDTFIATITGQARDDQLPPGPMGFANAQRMLGYTRVIVEFIWQPEYKDLIPMLEIVNEAYLPGIGRDVLSLSHNMTRGITGYGARSGPFISIHDDFQGTTSWASFHGSDIMLDTHPYFAFDGAGNDAPIATIRDLLHTGGLWLTQAVGGDCSLRLDTSTWNNTTKDGIKQFALDTDISNTLAASITTQSNICFSLPFSLGAAPLSLPSAPFPRSTQPPTPSQRPQARNLTHVGPLLPQKLRAELRSSFLLFHLPWRQRRGSDQPDLRRSATPLPTQQLHYEVEVGANASTGWVGLGFRIGGSGREGEGKIGRGMDGRSGGTGPAWARKMSGTRGVCGRRRTTIAPARPAFFEIDDEHLDNGFWMFSLAHVFHATARATCAREAVCLHPVFTKMRYTPLTDYTPALSVFPVVGEFPAFSLSSWMAGLSSTSSRCTV